MFVSFQVIPLHLPLGDTSSERTVQIDGTKEQIESAKQLVNEVISEVCRKATCWVVSLQTSSLSACCVS